MKLTSSTFSLLAALVLPLVARAEAAATATPAPTTPSTPSPPPYSLPWQLRPAAIATGIRSDTAIASYQDAAKKGTYTVASLLTATYKVTPEFAPFVRLVMVGTGKAGGMANPAIGGTYLFKPTPTLRLAAFLGFAIPAGEGGGKPTTPDVGNAVKSGLLARSAMENALFALNDFTVFPGVDLAYVNHGLTVQAEATVLFLTRVRGADVQKDASKVNFTTGLFAGYFLLPWLSVGGELRYQRWLSTPAAVAADSTGALRDTLSFAIGPRGNFMLGDGVWLRPGVAYARGIDKPMSAASYNIVQIDLPLTF